ncbi:YitT family protein [Herbaspirillum sp. alder98]|uniref:YitT family protein n=1 Tax=Herbaspirillum sp. alder98 TaxID=2913096 RepID=UPI001CD871C8|nr:YitT family protein [Herbaspirillum sp. alder98]MCA1324586.1 YitT family protein [Herbaspirillum sp. alder98]
MYFRTLRRSASDHLDLSRPALNDSGLPHRTAINPSETSSRAPLVPHNAWDDLYGLYLGVLFAAMGVSLLAKAGLITGGIAGMALLTSSLTGLAPAPLVPLINIPFIIFSFFVMGRFFASKSIVVSVAIGGVVAGIDHWLGVSSIGNGFAAIAGGTFLGMGILCLARHNASMGGTGAVALWIQRRYGINAGISQLAFDLALFGLAATSLPATKLLWSVLGTVAMNGMLIVWHKPGRYRG